MVELATNVLYGLVTSVIYDIGKVCLGKFKYQKDEITLEKVQTFVLEQLDERYIKLEQSGEFTEFINSPYLKDIIENYIIYKICGKCNGNIVKVKKRGYGINEKNIVDFLTEKVFTECYGDTLTVPSKTLVRQFFSEFFRLASEYVVSYLKSENKAMVYFINNRIDMVQETLLLKLNETTEIIKKTMECDMIIDSNSFRENVEEYHNILKTNNSKAHVYLLDTFEFDKFYVPPILNKLSGEQIIDHFTMMARDEKYYNIKKLNLNINDCFSDWKYIFDNNSIVYITGGAGYGKSLFLKKIINDFCNINILNSNDYLVIYGELKSFFKEDNQMISVTQFLQDSMIKETLIDKNKFPAEMIEYYIRNGRCLILLDALDEVQKDKRVELHKKVVAYFKNQNPNNKVCITSRNRGFIPERQVEVFDIAPLSKIQIESYVDNIIKLGKFDENDKDVFMEQSSVLVNKGFLNSFLVLSLLINIYKAERELPENKMELYQKCFEYIANRREKEKTQGKYDWKLITAMMKDNTFMELANMCLPNNSDIGKNEIVDMLCKTYGGKYSCEAETEQAAEHFLNFCSDRTELFVPAAGEDRFKFFHRSFFEYFYSQYIFHRIKTIEKIYDALSQFDVDSEVFELTFALMKQKDEYKYQELVEYIFTRMNEDIQKQNNKFSGLNMLILGMQVIDDKSYKKQFVDFLVENHVFIYKNIDKIHNQRIIVDVINESIEYIEKINDVYINYSILKLVEMILINYPEVVNLLKKIDSKSINEKEETNFIRRRIYFSYNGEFYTHIFLRTAELLTRLKCLTLSELEKIYTDCKVPKREKDKMIKLYSEFLKQKEKQRNKILEVLLSNVDELI